MQNGMHGARAASCLALACALAACSAGDTSTPRGGASAAGSGSGGFGGAQFTGAAGSFNNPMMPTGSSGFGGMAGTGVAGSPPNDMCAEANVHTSRNTPVILFVIDGSGSMCADFGGSTRWQSLRTALMDPAMGLIQRLQSTAEFGMVLYDGTIDILLAALGGGGGGMPVACAGQYTEMKAMGECPGLIQVPTAINNAAAIDAAFPATELGGSTPTDKAMKVAVDQLIAAQMPGPDAMIKPQYIILATDGQPNDICVGGVGGDGTLQKQNVIAEVDRAAAANITTFVVSLAGGDAALQAHLDEVALHGDPDNPMARTYSPETPEELVSALAALVGGAVGCDIFLNGMVQTGAECLGTVTLNGSALPCCQGTNCGGVPIDPANGWMLKDPSTITLVGETCTNFLVTADISLRAVFPCEVFIPD